MVHPDGTTTETTSVGEPSSGVVVGADGTAYQTTYTGSAADPYQTTVTVIHPNRTSTTMTIAGAPVGGVVVGADGTAYQTAYTGSGTAANPLRFSFSTISLAEPSAAMM